ARRGRTAAAARPGHRPVVGGPGSTRRSPGPEPSRGGLLPNGGEPAGVVAATGGTARPARRRGRGPSRPRRGRRHPVAHGPRPLPFGHRTRVPRPVPRSATVPRRGDPPRPALVLGRVPVGAVPRGAVPGRGGAGGLPGL